MELSQEARTILLDMKGKLSAGWIKGSIFNENGMCLLGAAAKAGNLMPTTHRNPDAILAKNRSSTQSRFHFHVMSDTPLAKAMLALAETAGISWEDLAVWNDDPNRTHQEIIDLIDKTLESSVPSPHESGVAADMQLNTTN